MRHLRQRYRSDCFPTCVAMIAGLSHEKALKAVHPKHKKGERYSTSIFQGAAALKRLKLRFKPSFAPMFDDVKLSDIKHVAIIKINWRSQERWRKNKKRFGHVVVWDPKTQMIYDPGYDRPLPRSLYERNMRWYIEILGKCKAVK